MLTLLLAAALDAAPDDTPDTATAEATAASDGAPAEEPAEAQPWDRTGWGFGGLPAINYNSDEGFGFGVVGSIYRYDGGTAPYKTAINVVLFMTTLGIHNHNVEVDTLEVADLPLRLTIRGAFNATRTSNYCGLGNEVSCDPAVAEAVADDLGLTGTERDDTVRRFYRTRFFSPELRADARWMLDDKPHRVELLLGYRATAMLPGDFSDPTPFPNSLYAQDFPGGEEGLVSVLQTGVMFDTRDNEPAPIRGYWIEGSIRGASKYWGSDYDYFGTNVTLRGYTPLGTDRLVLADRVMLDTMWGDANTLELATPGGTQRLYFYGQLNAGRGVRLRRFLGRMKAMNQIEVRATLLSPRVGNSVIDIGVLGFNDLGFVGLDGSEFGSMWSTPLPTYGGGLRFALDKNFIVRADVGVSPIEDYSPSVYIDIRNLF